MVLPWMLLAVPVAVVTEMAVKALFWAVLVQAVPAHKAALPPIKLPDTVNPFPVPVAALMRITL